MRALALIGFCLLLAFSACGGAGSDRPTGASATSRRKPLPRGPTVKMSKAEIKHLPPLTLPRPSGPPPHRLEVIDLRKGSGPGVPEHDWVTNREEVFIRVLEASYTGARKGRIFGRIPIDRVLLEGRSKGLTRGLTGMKVGGRRELIVPPKLAYPRWQPSWGYAPYVSIYVIDLVGMEPPPDRRVEYRNRPFGKRHGKRTLADLAKPPKVAIPPGSPPTHLIVRDIKRGSGPAIPRKGGVGIRTNYVSVSYRTGKPLEVKWEPRGAFKISFGPGLEVKGWEKGLVGMKVGGRRELRVPSRLAYGQGAVLYVVDLLGLRRLPSG